MKMAEKKSEEVVGKEKFKLQVKDPLIGRRSLSPKLRYSSPFEGVKASQGRGSSPVGKSLLERTNSRLKRTHSMMERDATGVNKHEIEALHTNGRQQSDRVGSGKPGEGGMASYKGGSGMRNLKAPVGRVAGEKEASGDRVKWWLVSHNTELSSSLVWWKELEFPLQLCNNTDKNKRQIQ